MRMIVNKICICYFIIPGTNLPLLFNLLNFRLLLIAMNTCSLSAANSGDRCVVLEIAHEPAELRSRLYALGIIPGNALEILRLAPFGDPMQVKVGGSFISIRKSEADIIQVEIQ